MNTFSWDDTFSVGVEKIDLQHQKLFDIANRFRAAYTARAHKAALQTAFDELIEYTKLHFADEERLMQEHNYPDYPKHKAQHERLVQLVVQCREQVVRGDDGAEMNAMEFIKTWLYGHILGTDKNYQPFLTAGR